MTGQQWQGDDAARMISYLLGDGAHYSFTQESGRLAGVTDRKLRLFACACVRFGQRLASDARLRHAIDVAERLADGEATDSELGAVSREVMHAMTDVVAHGSQCHIVWDTLHTGDIDRLAANAAQADWLPEGVKASLLRDIMGDPTAVFPAYAWSGGRLYADPQTFLVRPGAMTFSPSRHAAPVPWLTADVVALAHAAYDERQYPCHRCAGQGSWVYGLEETLWDCADCDGTGQVVSRNLDPVRLGILADALEEAGCDPQVKCHACGWGEECATCGGVGRVVEPLLAHLRRADARHVLGCWAVDLLRGV